jgi:peroxiredoxin
VKVSSEALCGPQSLQAGDIVPAFKTVDLRGQPYEVAFNGSTKTLIFVFSAACDVCAQEIPAWNALSAKLNSKKYVARGISIDSLEDASKNLAGKNLQCEVSVMPDAAILRAYRVVSIPVFMIVSEQGVVEWSHYGAMTKEKVKELVSKIEAES